MAADGQETVEEIVETQPAEPPAAESAGGEGLEVLFVAQDAAAVGEEVLRALGVSEAGAWLGLAAVGGRLDAVAALAGGRGEQVVATFLAGMGRRLRSRAVDGIAGGAGDPRGELGTLAADLAGVADDVLLALDVVDRVRWLELAGTSARIEAVAGVAHQRGETVVSAFLGGMGSRMRIRALEGLVRGAGAAGLAEDLAAMIAEAPAPESAAAGASDAELAGQLRTA